MHDDENDNNDDISSELEHQLLDDKGKDDTPVDASPKPQDISINVDLTSTGHQITLAQKSNYEVDKEKIDSNVMAEENGCAQIKSSSVMPVEKPDMEKSEDNLHTTEIKVKDGSKGHPHSDEPQTAETSRNEQTEQTSRNEATELTSRNEAKEQKGEEQAKEEISKEERKSTGVSEKSLKQKRKRSDSCNSSCSNNCSACIQDGGSSQQQQQQQHYSSDKEKESYG